MFYLFYKKSGNVRIKNRNAFALRLLPWESNKYYVL